MSRKPFWIKPAIICINASARRSPTTRGTATNCPITASGRNWIPNSSVGDTTYYKLEAKTAWYFPGFFKGHVLEADGRAGVADRLDRRRRAVLRPLLSRRPLLAARFQISQRRPARPDYGSIQYPQMPNEPIGGDSYWFGSLEYSIPILEKDNGPSVRFALFYDAGAVGADPYSFSGNFDDD